LEENLMPMHDWTRVAAGIFHAFHHNWITEMARVLNGGLLPDDYYALPEQQAAGFGPDVLALQSPSAVEPESSPSSGGTSTIVRTRPRSQFTAGPGVVRRARIRYNQQRPFFGGTPMMLVLNLPEALERRLRWEADRREESIETVALRLLEQHLPTEEDRRAAAIALLEQWMKEDENLSDEEAAENEEIFRNIDANRSPDRPLFPPDLKGITW
jgi:plasmid stability protein